MRVPFTAALIQSLHFERRPVSWSEKGGLKTEPTSPKVHDWILRDASTPGFGIRLTRGSASYFVQRKRGSSTSDRWVLQDQHNLTAARKQAVDWLAAMARGDDPREVKRKKARDREEAKQLGKNTFGTVYQRFVHEGVNLKPGSIKDRAKVIGWMDDSALWETPLHLVDKALVAATFKPIFEAADRARAAKRAAGDMKTKRGGGAKQDVATAWKCLTLSGTCWNRADGQKATHNPFAAWRKEHKKTLPLVEPRTQVLSTNRTKGQAWLKALDALRADERHRVSVVADYLMLVLMWGGRKTETRLLRWRDVSWDDGQVCFDPETTKARKAHYMPLTPWASQILKGRRDRNEAAGYPVSGNSHVFPTAAIMKGREIGQPIVDYRGVSEMLQDQTGLWIRAHDLRRTLASEIFGTTQNVATVEIALGHGSKKSVTRGYIQSAVEALRPLYEAREKRLREVIGLDAATGMPVISEAQQGMVAAAMAILKQAGLGAGDLIGLVGGTELSSQ
jgi:integrase